MRGEVAVISPDTVKTEDGNTAYIVRLVTEEVQFSSREAKFNLYPGLVLDCSIVIGERSILLNIIAPLIDMKHSANARKCLVKCRIRQLAATFC